MASNVVSRSGWQTTKHEMRTSNVFSKWQQTTGHTFVMGTSSSDQLLEPALQLSAIHCVFYAIFSRSSSRLVNLHLSNKGAPVHAYFLRTMSESKWSELPFRPRFSIDHELAPPPPSYQDHQRNKRIYPDDIEMYQVDRASDGPIPPLRRIPLEYIQHRSRSAVCPPRPPPYAIDMPANTEILSQTQTLRFPVPRSRGRIVRRWVRRFGNRAWGIIQLVPAMLWALTPRSSWFWGTIAAFVVVFGFIAIMGFVVLPN